MLHNTLQDLDLIEAWILKQVMSSSLATPIVAPLTQNRQPRVCGDFRITGNPQLRQTVVTTPTIEDMFEGLQGSMTFFKIDWSNAFH